MEPIQLSPEQQPENEDNAVSLGSPVDQTQQEGVALGAPLPTSPALPNNVATTRATKIQQGVGKYLQKTTEEIQQEIQQGRENNLRAIAASNMEVEKQRTKLNMLTTLANQKGGPLDENEVAHIMDPFNPLNKPVDPDSVVEKQYATKFVSTIEDAMSLVPDTPVQKAKEEIPDQYNGAMLKGSVLTAKMEFARKIREDLSTQVSNQSYVGWGADQLKQMFQPYNEYMLRGNVDGVGTFSGGVLLGTNLQEQADKLFSLPYDEYTKQFREITTRLAKDNPSLAARFAAYVEGLPATDRILDNAFSVMAPLDYAAMGSVGVGIARKISLNNRANTAVRQLVEAADRVQVDPAARAEAAGDLSTSAETRSSKIILQNLSGNGDPIQTLKEPLLTFLNQDKEKIATNPGGLSTEQVTRIQNSYDASGQTFIQRILDAARINRTPMPLAVSNSVKILKDAAAEYYRGIRNSILDISDPLYEPRSNTYWHEITVGNFDGNLFSDPKTAQKFAKLHGIDADIVEGTGPITNKDTQKLLDRHVQLEKHLKETDEALDIYGTRAKDKDLPEAKRREAQEEYESFRGFKKDFTKEINDVKLRLKGSETYDRVANLQSEIELLRISNADTRKIMRATAGPDAASNAETLQSIIKENQQKIYDNAQEIKAIQSGKAEVLGKKDTIQQHGVGFKLVLRRPLVETDKAVRDLMIRDSSGKIFPEAVSTGSQTGFKAMANAVFGKLRGADDTLAINESIQRKIGTYTQSLFKEWAQQEAQYIRQLASGVVRVDPVTGANIPYWKAKPRAILGKLTGDVKQTYNEFVRVLDHARDDHDPVTGLPGYFKQTPGELEQLYQTFFNRQPSFTEHQAYFAFVRMVEGDRIMREISEFRNRARLGVEQVSIGARLGPKQVKSDYFDARTLKVFPGGDDVLMIMGRRLGDEKLVNLGGAGINPKDLERMRDNVLQGKAKVYEVYASEHKPLRSFSDIAGNEHVRYVYTEGSADTKPIEFNHVNRRGGGHFEYDYDNFLKQANMYHQYENVDGVKGRFRSVYTGDTTFMPVLNRVMGKDIAGKLHEVQRLLREGDIEGAKAWTQAHLPIEWDKLHSMFKPGRDENGKPTSPQLDLHEPFVVVPKGLTILDMGKDLELRYGKSFKDAAKSGSLNKQFQVAYNTERESYGLTHLDDIGTQGNPLYKYSPTGKMIDPITTMNKSLNRIVNSVFMDDYKIYAVEHWLREAEDHLKGKHHRDTCISRFGISKMPRMLLHLRQELLRKSSVTFSLTDTRLHSSLVFLTR
jgi:hypothetical protein